MKLRFKNIRSRYILNSIAILALYGVLMLMIQTGALNRYAQGLLITAGYNIILAVSLNLTAGFLGQLPLGHAGFMSVGAYTAALFTLGVKMDGVLKFPLALIVGGLVAAFFGILIGLPVLRLSGDYLAIITLGFGEIIRVVILNLPFTGGAFGLQGMQRYTNFTNIFIFAVLTLFIISTLIKSRHGRAILAIREDEIAAEASGIPTTYYKTFAFAVSAFFAGVAGGLYAHHLCILDPSTFGFMKSVEILVMVVLGGMGSLIGSVVAAFGLTLLPELLREFAQFRMIIYSLLLVIAMIFKPSGLFGKYDFSLGKTVDDALSKIRTPKQKKGGA